MTMYKQLVVSHYEKDLTWIKKVSDYIDIVVYDKSGNYSEYNKLENVGREPHSYIHHIIENYNSLSEWTIFSQDDPFEHVNDWLEILSKDEITWDKLATFKQKGCYFFSNYGILPSDQNGSPSHPGLPIVELWERTFIEKCPEYLEFVPSCHFIIHRDMIHVRSIEFYKNMMHILETNQKSPWALERYITYIFNPEVI
jgi:hypothetical protein